MVSPQNGPLNVPSCHNLCGMPFHIWNKWMAFLVQNCCAIPHVFWHCVYDWKLYGKYCNWICKALAVLSIFFEAMGSWSECLVGQDETWEVALSSWLWLEMHLAFFEKSESLLCLRLRWLLKHPCIIIWDIISHVQCPLSQWHLIINELGKW